MKLQDLTEDQKIGILLGTATAATAYGIFHAFAAYAEDRKEDDDAIGTKILKKIVDKAKDVAAGRDDPPDPFEIIFPLRSWKDTIDMAKGWF